MHKGSWETILQVDTKQFTQPWHFILEAKNLLKVPRIHRQRNRQPTSAVNVFANFNILTNHSTSKIYILAYNKQMNKLFNQYAY